MNAFRSNRALIVAAWLLLTIVYAAVYVLRALQLPELEGYEKEWQFQLLAFCYARLPVMILLLVTGLIAERIVARRRNAR